MKHYFQTRHLVPVLTTALAITVLLAVVSHPFVISWPDGVTVFSWNTPGLWLITATLGLALSGRTEQFEFAGARSLPLLRMLNVALLTSAGLTVAVALSAVNLLMDPTSMTTGPWAPIRAILGLLGITLAFASFLDVRIASLPALAFALAPLTTNTRSFAGGDIVGFILADAQSVPASAFAFTIFVVGAGAFVAFYSERQSPSTNQRALRDARARLR